MKKSIWVLAVVAAIAVAGCTPPDREASSGESATPKAPVAAPSFSLETIDGETVASQDIIGEKSVMLVFWATWCVKCRAEMPEINALHEKYDGPTFQIIGVNGSESPEKVSRFLEKIEIKYSVLLDRKGQVGKSFRVPGFPWSVIIDRDGMIRHNGPALPEDPDAAISAVL